jgi:hypothetical protein
LASFHIHTLLIFISIEELFTRNSKSYNISLASDSHFHLNLGMMSIVDEFKVTELEVFDFFNIRVKLQLRERVREPF